MGDTDLIDDTLVDVTSFLIIDNYALQIEFDDNTERIINFEPILFGPLFGPLRNLTLFNQVELNQDIGTLIWPTGADIDPNVLHDWPEHVDAIIARRNRQFATTATSD